MKTENILNNLGLSNNETKIYLASLEMGTASVQSIAKKADIIRTTAYSVLENLVEKNFMHKTKEKTRNRFFAEEPKNLVHRFAEYQKELQAKLPELEAVYNKNKIKPKIIFYEGKEGLLEIYEDTIKEKPKEILEYNTTDIYQTFPDFPKEYLAKRFKNQIHAKRIASDDEKTRIHAQNDQKELSETILLSQKDFNIPVEINIYNHKVAFMSYADEIGVLIESAGIADAMKQIYNLLWNKLKKK